MDLLHFLEKTIDRFFALIPRKCTTVNDISKVKIVAHRGAHSKLIKENTLQAFAEALKLGCYGIELDIQTTKDKVLVVNHDPTLTRLWHYQEKIEALTFPELRKKIPEIPTLAEVLSQFGKKIHLFIELKTPFDSFDELKEILKGFEPEKDYHLICLDHTLFNALTTFPKKALLLVPMHNNVNAFCKICLEKKYGGILGHYLLFSNRHLRQFQDQPFIIGVGFVDSKYSLYRELNRGISLLFTNNVARITKLISSMKFNKGPSANASRQK